MSPASIVLLVVGANVVIQGTVWFFILRWVRRRRAALTETLRAMIGGEPTVCGPEPAHYTVLRQRRARQSAGVAALTPTRVLFAPLRGEPVEVPRAALASVRADRWFGRTWRSGYTHVILQLRDGTETSVSVRDPQPWLAGLG